MRLWEGPLGQFRINEDAFVAELKGLESWERFRSVCEDVDELPGERELCLD